jgi:nucleotide-binding universal stress UspA family protein
MLCQVLIPLDGTRLAEAVLPLAASLAEKAKARVSLLHVLERAARPSVHGQPHLTTADEAQGYLERIVREEFPPGVAVDWHVHRRPVGDVAHSLADHAEELEPDLIVMLAHGRPTIGQRLFGTVPQQVIRQTSTPVLLVHAAPDRPAPDAFRQLAVSLDGRAEHEVALPLAAELAGLYAAPVRLVMAIPTRGMLSGSPSAVGQLLPAATTEVLDLAELQGVEYLREQVERLQAAGVAAAATIARGDPADVLSQAIVQSGADLVALGTHGAAGTAAFWSGSMGQKLLDRVSASFLLVPAPAAP